MSTEDPTGQLTALVKTAESTLHVPCRKYLHVSPLKSFPKFHGSMIIAKKQLKKARKAQRKVVVNQHSEL